MVSPELIDGVMAHPFYQPDEKVAFDQQPKPDALSLSCRSTRQKHPQDVMNRSTRRTSPAKEAGGRGGSTKSRTRVAVSRISSPRSRMNTDMNSVIDAESERSSAVETRKMDGPVRTVRALAMRIVITCELVRLLFVMCTTAANPVSLGQGNAAAYESPRVALSYYE